MMIELVTGVAPFAGTGRDDLVRMAATSTMKPSLARWPTTGAWAKPEWRQLVQDCTALQPTDRPTVAVLMDRLRALDTTDAAYVHVYELPSGVGSAFDLSEWLSSIDAKLPPYASVLREQGFEGREDLPDLSETVMEKLKIPIRFHEKLLKAIQALKQ